MAKEADRLSYDSLWVYDHFHTVPVPSIEATFECRTLMAALAVETQRIRLGQMVFDRIRAYEQVGINYMICYLQDAARDQTPMRLFAERVIPAFR